MTTKKTSTKSNKVTSKKNNNHELPVTEKKDKFSEIDLSSLGTDIDISTSLKKAESQKKIRLGPVYFPNDNTVEGEFVEGVYLGTVDFENDKQEKFKGVVVAPSPKERVICISEKAVTRLASIPVGTKVELTYLGDIRTGSGFVMRNIAVSFFE